MSWRPAILVLALAASMALVTWRTAAAQPYDGFHHRGVAALCGWDLDRYCGHAQPRRAGHLVCLARHAESLSPPCYRALRFAAAVDGCADDYQRYCGQVPPGGGRIISCLRGNADRLSALCVRALRGPGPRTGVSRHERGDQDAPGEGHRQGPDDPIK
jgi:hypothetical protein